MSIYFSFPLSLPKRFRTYSSSKYCEDQIIANRDHNNECCWLQLPTEIYCIIMEDLHPSDLLNLSQSCSSFRRMMKTHLFWKSKWLHKGWKIPSHLQSPNSNWKHSFCNRLTYEENWRKGRYCQIVHKFTDHIDMFTTPSFLPQTTLPTQLFMPEDDQDPEQGFIISLQYIDQSVKSKNGKTCPPAAYICFRDINTFNVITKVTSGDRTISCIKFLTDSMENSKENGVEYSDYGKLNSLEEANRILSRKIWFTSHSDSLSIKLNEVATETATTHEIGPPATSVVMVDAIGLVTFDFAGNLCFSYGGREELHYVSMTTGQRLASWKPHDSILLLDGLKFSNSPSKEVNKDGTMRYLATFALNEFKYWDLNYVRGKFMEDSSNLENDNNFCIGQVIVPQTEYFAPSIKQCEIVDDIVALSVGSYIYLYSLPIILKNYKTSTKNEPMFILNTVSSSMDPALNSTTEFSTISNFYMDETKIVCGLIDGTIQVWDVKSGKLITTLRHKHQGLRSIHVIKGKMVTSSTSSVIVWHFNNFVSCYFDKPSKLKKAYV